MRESRYVFSEGTFFSLTLVDYPQQFILQILIHFLDSLVSFAQPRVLLLPYAYLLLHGGHLAIRKFVSFVEELRLHRDNVTVPLYEPLSEILDLRMQMHVAVLRLILRALRTDTAAFLKKKGDNKLLPIRKI